jgi:hypothetical protein
MIGCGAGIYFFRLKANNLHRIISVSDLWLRQIGYFIDKIGLFDSDPNGHPGPE